MKTVMCFVAVFSGACAQASAQTAVAGLWRVDVAGRGAWTVVLDVDRSELTGTVSHCASYGAILPAEISEARMNGNTVSFKCKSVDGRRSITFTGEISGDAMVLTWEQQVQDGAAPIDELFGGMFGSETPRRLIAKRVGNGGTELAAAVNLVHKGVNVEGTLFLPANVARVRSVVVLINPGTSWEGLARSLYYEPEVRTLSATLDSSLLLLRITNISQAARMYFVSGAGAGAADGLLMLLNALARDSGHPELATVPLLIWGHSAAGVFGPTFAVLHPHRTIAFVAYHSGPPAVDVGSLATVPALFFTAGKDVAERFDGKRPHRALPERRAHD